MPYLFQAGNSQVMSDDNSDRLSPTAGSLIASYQQRVLFNVF
jgi:hypothetical protein